jgi:hypothetical protein
LLDVLRAYCYVCTCVFYSQCDNREYMSTRGVKVQEYTIINVVLQKLPQPQAPAVSSRLRAREPREELGPRNLRQLSPTCRTCDADNRGHDTSSSHSLNLSSQKPRKIPLLSSTITMDHSHMDHGHMDHGMPGMDHGSGPQCNMNVRSPSLPDQRRPSIRSLPNRPLCR